MSKPKTKSDEDDTVYLFTVRAKERAAEKAAVAMVIDGVNVFVGGGQNTENDSATGDFTEVEGEGGKPTVVVKC